MPATIVDNGKQLKEVFAQGMALARYGGGGDATLIVCGYMECDREFSKMFLGGLPPVFKVNIRNDNSGQWLENSIKFSAREAEHEPRGQRCGAGPIVRSAFCGNNAPLHGRIAGTADRLARRGARSLGGSGARAHPSRSGTSLDDCESRSAGGNVAVRARGTIPAFSWRTAHDVLVALEAAARRAHVDFHQPQRGQDFRRDVGYESEPAFNRAFKRELGVPPRVSARKPNQRKARPVLKRRGRKRDAKAVS